MSVIPQLSPNRSSIVFSPNRSSLGSVVVPSGGYEADGKGTASASLQIQLLAAAKCAQYGRIYTAYPTTYTTSIHVFTGLNSLNAVIGKVPVTGTGKGDGDRVGFSLPIPSNLVGSGDFTLNIILGAWLNTLETFNPSFYASNTDDSAYTGTWYNNLDTYLGGVYGLSGNQAILVPEALVTAKAGGFLSFLLGEDQELAGTGILNGSGPRATFTVEKTGSPLAVHITLTR